MSELDGRTGKELPALQVVFSVDDSQYLDWQSQLLAYSYRKVGQPGSLTRLWSSRWAPNDFPGETFWAEPYNPHPFTGDDYSAYNKPAAIREWLSGSSPPEDTVLILDPDCVFLHPISVSAERGRPISQPISYMQPKDEVGAQLVERHCRNPGLVQGVGIPTLIHRDDLAVLAPLWLAKTEAIRADKRSRELAGWTAEMWGYAFAAAELGLRHELRDLAAFPMDNRSDLPIVHYCYDAEDRDKQWLWGKRTYQPWEPVPAPPEDIPQAAVALVDLVNELAATQQFSLAP